jgi:hypothetical protein
MVWPTGFIKAHKKQTIEYKSDSCLHNGKYPLIAPRLVGGIVIDLRTTDVESQVAQLLDVRERASDEELCVFIENLANQIRGRPLTQASKHAVNVLTSQLLEQLPRETKQNITA